MSGSQCLADIHIVRERQITGRRRHTVTANHDRAVVQRCVVLKNIDQKLARHDTIDLDARPLDLSERRAPLDDDQGARLDFSHLKTSTHQLRDRLFAEILIFLRIIR